MKYPETALQREMTNELLQAVGLCSFTCSDFPQTDVRADIKLC